MYEPITRKEKYLAAMCRMSCMECDIPEPISREEEIFDYILGNRDEKPKCITKTDKFLMRIADSDTEVPVPLTRYETFLAAASGLISPDSVPTPITKVENYLMEYATTEETVDDTEAYSKAIQDGANNLATISYIGGKSYVQDGELLSASSKKVISKDAEGTVIDELVTDYGTLRSAGDVYDCIDFKRKVIVRKIGNYTLTGEENWIFVDEGENTCRCRMVFAIAKNNGQGICTESQWVTTGVSLDQEVTGVVGGHLYYRIAKTKLDEVSVEGFKRYLSEHQITINYELAEPIEEPIILKDKNILVEGGGSLTFVSDQEANVAVPSTVTYRKKRE